MANELGTCLDEAKKIINGHRQNEYGSPENSFDLIAQLWGDYINALLKRDGGLMLASQDVAMMMVLLKVARSIKKYKEDNAIDIAGYAALYDELEKKFKTNNGTV